MDEPDSIYIMDQITPKPGQGKEFFDHYMSEYAPLAIGRGMALEQQWVSPPIWLEADQSNTLFFLWSVKGIGGFWQSMSDPSSLNGSTGDWWRDAQGLIAERKRSILGDAASIERLTNV